MQSRIRELYDLGVAALEFSGATSVFGVKVPVLGKGFVGIVVVAHVNGERTAVKILRQDAGRRIYFMKQQCFPRQTLSGLLHD